MHLIKKLSVFLIILFLNGCSLFGPIKNTHENTYIINTLNPNVIHAPRTCLTLLINPVVTTQAYNTTQIAYSLCPYQLSYYSKNYWADTPADMLLPLMVQALHNTCHYHAITILPSSEKYDLVLNSQLIQLQQEFCPNSSRIHLVFRAQMVQASTQHVIAECQFNIYECAPCNNPYGGVIAANRAVAKLLTQLANFSVQVS